MQYFRPEEFHGWYADLGEGLKTKLDAFRSLWGRAVIVSPHPKAVGRHLGPDNTSKHNIDYWEEVLAVDVMPTGVRGQDDMEHAAACAVEAGFTGIGVYPFWSPRPGLHLDDRPFDGRIHTWAGIPNPDKQKRKKKPQIYISMDAGLEKMA